MSDYFEMVAPLRPCTRALRREGLAVRTPRCLRCGGGPCVVETVRAIPNRLYGATINSEGDAI